jgi:hypothetical protein
LLQFTQQIKIKPPRSKYQMGRRKATSLQKPGKGAPRLGELFVANNPHQRVSQRVTWRSTKAWTANKQDEEVHVRDPESTVRRESSCAEGIAYKTDGSKKKRVHQRQQIME